jgi:uncharacterized membrane protein YgdD (TMEM256/DUF423 family)
MTASLVLVLGALNGALAVALGAFGAHGLRARLDPASLEIYQTAVQYHAIHALALLAVALLLARGHQGTLAGAGWAFTAGIVFFSGSLYLLSTTGPRWLGAVAPIGGTALIVGWVLLAVGGWKALS